MTSCNKPEQYGFPLSATLPFQSGFPLNIVETLPSPQNLVLALFNIQTLCILQVLPSFLALYCTAVVPRNMLATSSGLKRVSFKSCDYKHPGSAAPSAGAEESALHSDQT